MFRCKTPSSGMVFYTDAQIVCSLRMVFYTDAEIVCSLRMVF